MSFLLLVCLVLFVSSVALAGDQSVGVQGTLMCGSKPLADTVVKLWELDMWPNPDDELMSVKTDKQGRFKVWGTESEFMSINPVLKIYHRCDNKNIFHLSKICKRKVTYSIPKSYIAKGKTVKKWYDFGTVNMEAKQKDEGTECIQIK